MESTTETTHLLTATTQTFTSNNEENDTSNIIYIYDNGKQREVYGLNENKNYIIQVRPEKDEEKNEDEKNYLWYLAYGSNMSTKTLTGFRGIKPKLSRACHVPNYFLSFDLRGTPYVEPCTGNILHFSPPTPTDGSHPIITREYAWEVHRRCNTGMPFEWDEKNPMDSLPPVLQGILYKITKEQYQKILMTEGVWGWDDIPTGYKELEVECVTYDGEKIVAKTLISKPGSISRDLQASERYLNILKEGAREHNMNYNYQTYLARKIAPYKITTTRKKIGKRVPRWVAVYALQLFKSMYIMHDRYFEPYFGSGNNNLDEFV
ncbi:8686_t:CDS:2 [Ambispora leptoticha]|uniref:gamma-glutamylcyclotransferase n=1 Tax=Ambispora leptoticha TaxID=144679 RepID=A0A9N9HE88_9GLOM|nr:8686_t:CDS:2 [Ambispora leptoticha]